MTYQRDRLAAVLHDNVVGCDIDYDGYCGTASHHKQADALLARGVRVVDYSFVHRILDALDRTEREIEAAAERRFMQPINPDPVTRIAKEMKG